jgi:hypothetical protein
MTTEERLNRSEHFTAAEAEQRRKEREENRQIWRDTQRQIDQLTADTSAAITRTNAAITHLAEESREADARLGARIDASGMGQFMAKVQPLLPKE